MEESIDHSGQNVDGDDPTEMQACCYCHCQGNVQATLRPAIWCPGFRTPHMYREKWQVATNPAVCMDEIIHVVRKINSENHGGKLYELANVNHENNFIQINLYSYGQWLSIIDFSFSQEEKSSVTDAKVRSFSTGCVPVTVPFSFLWNSLFCCIPFYDCGKNKKWLTSIRTSLPLNITVTKSKRGC